MESHSIFFSRLCVAIMSFSCLLENFVSANPITVSQVSTKLFYGPCPGVSVKGTLITATFNGTVEGKIAVLHKGQYVGIDFSFTTKEKISKLTSRVSGEVRPLPFINFPLDNPDGCKGSGITCPFDANTKQDLKTVLHIPGPTPAVNVFVKWELLNGDNDHLFCIIIPAKVV